MATPSANTARIPQDSPPPTPLLDPTPERKQATASPAPLAAQPFAAIVDNISEARPQVGLDKADVVYEAPAEGGIPRLLPVYLKAGAGDVPRIGPVRSVRHYFVYLANEYRAPLVHVGASPLGFVALRETNLPDVDESRGDPGFTRDPRRAPPHNAFVSIASVRGELAARGVPGASTLGPLVFGLFIPGSEPARTVTINYPGAEGYQAGYIFDDESGTYLRSMDGKAHRDGVSGAQYAARSIIVHYASVTPIPNDDAGRLDVQLVGAGKGLLIAGGTQVQLQWSRYSIHEPTRYRRTDGQPFALPTGQVWIQIVPLETIVSIT